MPFLVLWVLFWTACTLGLDYEIGGAVIRQLASNNYSTTTGEMLHSEVTMHHGRKRGVTYGLKLEYRYRVAGRQYTGTRYRYGDKHDWNQSAYAVVAALTPGETVTVYFHPANPSDALLAPGVQGRDLFALLFMMPFNIVAVASWYFGYQALRRRIAPPVAAGAKIFASDTHIAVRLPEVNPLGAALAMGFAVSFISLLAIGIGVGTRPSWCLMTLVWSGVFLAMVWAYWREARDTKNLLIDRMHRRLQLPLTFGRRQQVLVPLENVEDLAIETKVHTSNKGKVSRSFQTMLVWRDVEGNIRRDQLTNDTNERDAQSLAAWLDEQFRRPGSTFAGGQYAIG